MNDRDTATGQDAAPAFAMLGVADAAACDGDTCTIPDTARDDATARDPA